MAQVIHDGWPADTLGVPAPIELKLMSRIGPGFSLDRVLMKRILSTCGGITTGPLPGICALALALCPLSAWGYIGPGLGTGVVATVLGVLVGFLMLLVGIVWYPLKRLIRRLRSKKQTP